jgi:hypothetical protein
MREDGLIERYRGLNGYEAKDHLGHGRLLDGLCTWLTSIAESNSDSFAESLQMQITYNNIPGGQS